MDITINMPQTENNSNSAKALSLNNGLIWFICFVPLIGLFLENYANSATAGAVLWILVPLFMIGCSVADCKQLINGYGSRRFMYTSVKSCVAESFTKR